MPTNADYQAYFNQQAVNQQAQEQQQAMRQRQQEQEAQSVYLDSLTRQKEATQYPQAILSRQGSQGFKVNQPIDDRQTAQYALDQMIEKKNLPGVMQMQKHIASLDDKQRAEYSEGSKQIGGMMANDLWQYQQDLQKNKGDQQAAWAPRQQAYAETYDKLPEFLKKVAPKPNEYTPGVAAVMAPQAMLTHMWSESSKKEAAAKKAEDKKLSINGISDTDAKIISGPIADGRLDPNHVNNRTAQIYIKLFKDNPNLDFVNASSTAAAQKIVEKQRSMVESFEKTASKNFDMIEQMYDKLPADKSVYILNKLRTKWDTDFSGDPQLVPLARSMKTALTEYAKVITGQTGGAAVSDSARAEVETLLSAADRPETFKASLKAHLQEMRNRMSAFQETIDNLKGGRGGNVRGQAQQGAAGTLTETAARKALSDKGISGPQADAYIKKYRDAGKIQ